MTQVLAETIEHRDGVPWYDAPKPRRLLHRHEWQTRAQMRAGYWIERCACGATHYSDIPGWKEEREPRFK